jgi:hypothetical protein
MGFHNNTEKTPGVFFLPSGAPAPRGTPGVLTRSGRRRVIVLVRSDALAPQLERYLQAGIRRVEMTIWIEGLMVTVMAAIIRRGRYPLHLHPLGQAGKFLAELYNQRLAASGRKRNPLPLLILSITPLIERTTTSPKIGGA